MANLRHQTSILRSIQADTSDLNRTKVIYHGRMTDGTNPYLPNANYDGSPVYFYWENDTDKTIYIEHYFLGYSGGDDEPSYLNLYHSPTWESKVGLFNEAETDIEEPCVTYKYNFDLMSSSLTGKKNWVGTTVFFYDHNFTSAPIKIEPGRKFAQYVAGNLTVDLANNLYGRVEGYYYE